MQKIKAHQKTPNFDYHIATQNKLDFYEETKGKKVILSFLRYDGCPVCKMEMGEYKRDFDLLKDKNTLLFVVLQSAQESILKSKGNVSFPFTIICDPKGQLFDTFGVEASLIKYLHPKAIVGVIKATSKGYMHGKFEGKETQIPATFIIDEDKKVLFAHYGKNITDVPNIPALLPYL